MADNLLTKCPHCGTTFRLTQAQLDIAGGAVRCGACYQVFHAAEHIVKTSVVEERRTVTKPPDPVEEAFDMKSDEGMDPYDSEDLNLEESSEEVFSEEYRAGLDEESSMEEFGYQDKKPKKKDKSDESWAEELLKELGEDEDDQLIHDGDEDDKQGAIISGDSAFSLDDDEPAAKKKKPKKGNELSDTFASLGNFASEDPFAISDIEEEEFGGEANSDDESWAKAMLDELEEEETPKKAAPAGLSLLTEDEPEVDNSPFAARELSKDKKEISERAKQEKAKQKSLAKSQVKPKEKLRNDETEDFFRLLDEDLTPAQQQKSDKRTEPALKDFDDELEDAEDEAITPENLFADSDEVINQQIRLSALEYGNEEYRASPRNGLWGFLMVILLLTLAGQYVYFNFDSISRIATIRPYLEEYCPMIGCEPASQSDVASIVGTNLVVRSHPYEKNALVIDVIIKNQAQFDQPYPDVQLNFEDINGEPVASRRFAPAEYISDKSIPLDSMPSDTPIHLTLEIEDPGRNAVNYELLFLPHSSAS